MQTKYIVMEWGAVGKASRLEKILIYLAMWLLGVKLRFEKKDKPDKAID